MGLSFTKGGKLITISIVLTISLLPSLVVTTWLFRPGSLDRLDRVVLTDGNTSVVG
jgi:hypothetical protein